jgi:hypothetical protein
MDNALPWIRLPSLSQWRELVLPKEHGSWSLALEPLAFGLIAAPSAAGGCLALAVAAAFFARRPLRIASRDGRLDRRRDAIVALSACATVALIAFACAVALAGANWLVWLAPSAVSGALFLSFDLRNGGREETAEIAGSAAFAFLPSAFAILDGATPGVALALGLVMCGRAVPTVLAVRSALRGAKTGVRRPVPALVAAVSAAIVGGLLTRSGLAPASAFIALAILAMRAFALLAWPRPPLRARTLGMIEAVLGLLFVGAVAVTWPAFTS